MSNIEYSRSARIKTPCEYRCLHCDAVNRIEATKAVFAFAYGDGSDWMKDAAAAKTADEIMKKIESEKDFVKKDLDKYQEYVDSGKLERFINSSKIFFTERPKKIEALSGYKCRNCGSKQIWQIDTNMRKNALKVLGLGFVAFIAFVVLLAVTGTINHEESPLLNIGMPVMWVICILGGMLGPYVYYRVTTKKMKADAKAKYQQMQDYLPKIVGENRYEDIHI